MDKKQIGRPRVPDEQKRRGIYILLPQDIIFWLREQTLSQGKTIEAALVKYRKKIERGK